MSEKTGAGDPLVQDGQYDSGMTYGGILSFLRCPYSRDLASADVVVSGIPFDNAVTYRPGARLGPRAIRAGSVQLAELKPFPYGFDLHDHLKIIDYGDCRLDSHRAETITGDITAHIRNILKHDAIPLSLGGDHFVTYPILKAIAEKHGPVALVHFDAHCDTWPDEDGEELNHGNMFLRAKNQGLLDVEHSVQVGLRTFNDEDHGFEILSAPWVHRNGVAATLEAILERVGDKKAYLTFDIDCLDPAFAPGTGTPVSGGLTPAQVLEIFYGLGSIDFVGMDVVEVAPAYDISEITAIAGATLAQTFLCLLAEKRGAKTVPVGRL
jgi:agmatinase